MSKQRTGKNPPDISDLPADACPVCGTRMRQRKARLVFPVNGEKVAVPDALHLRCPKDGEIVLRLDDARHLRERALTLYREKYGLLSSDEIRSLRERRHLTHGALAKLLRLDRLLRLKVLPISLAAPWGLNIGDFVGHIPLPAKITVSVLEPVDLRKKFGPNPSLEKSYNHITRLMQRELDRLAAERRLPLLG